jgi:Carboxypeptidase regulatory-like domain/TonB dependent receptor/TonB-dependent Receptor Plug Domain
MKKRHWFSTCFFLGCLCLYLSCLVNPLPAQSTSATINGQITDPQGKIVPGAEVRAVNIDTNIAYSGKTNNSGIYAIPDLPPGRYRLVVRKDGFKEINKTDLLLHVQDTLEQNFSLEVGAVGESVTVTGGVPLINRESAAVSTVIDRTFVEHLPLNGRSFNTLLQLTPGVVVGPTNIFSGGQFSIAGQRSDANNFMVDGVSANFGVSANSASVGSSGLGGAQAFSALGGTSGLVSVEALQEFRVETSSFAPEFGRTPGGQVILTTRSGTNDFHGGVYEYFRNDGLDANDWFANRLPGRPHAPERHNDFGGFLGGPIFRDRSFFFLSYEGARLRLPQSTVVQVPSMFARSQAPPALTPFLNAYALPNGQPSSPTALTAPFTGVFSNQASVDSGSVRVDHAFNDRFSLFGRYSDAPSQIVFRVGTFSTLQVVAVDTQTLTVGSNMRVGATASNYVRGNYSMQGSNTSFKADSFGGATQPDAQLLLRPLSAVDASASFGTFDTSFVSIMLGPSVRNHTSQLNFADDLALTTGLHQLKLGADYRAIFLNINPPRQSVTYTAVSVQSLVSTGTASVSGGARAASDILVQSFSAYGQDTWKISPRFTLTYGLRWELSPAPSARGSTTLAAWQNVDDPAQIALAPFGTSLWNKTYTNFAPRVGAAYSLKEDGSFVLRAGWGIFYDLGQGQAGSLGGSFPNTAVKSTGGVSLPVSDVTPLIATISLQPPFSFNVIGFSPDLKLPRSYQWNVALEKSFGSSQAVSATYVGQAGRNLLRVESLFKPNPNFLSTFQVTNNSAASDYHALQLQYRKLLSHGVQTLLNYTWSHSLDNASDDTVVFFGTTAVVNSGQLDRGSSDFDVRHSFSGAVTFALPYAKANKLLTLLTRDWSVETLVVARSGFPFNLRVSSSSPIPAPGNFSRPDVVLGQPAWISSSSAPGGRIINAAAFAIPTTRRQGTEARNDIPGFGLTEVDFSIGRKFAFTERISLQFRTDAFNLMNHPNFTNPIALFGFGPAFLQSSSMANQSLGGAGLNPLFQEGGPRSLQLSLKLQF